MRRREPQEKRKTPAACFPRPSTSARHLDERLILLKGASDDGSAKAIDLSEVVKTTTAADGDALKTVQHRGDVMDALDLRLGLSIFGALDRSAAEVDEHRGFGDTNSPAEPSWIFRRRRRVSACHWVQTACV